MTKNEFLLALEEGLHGLPQSDINERVDFYSEIIDDHIENGLSEDEAVAEVGDVAKICEQIISETPISKIVKQRVKPRRRLSVLEILLIVLGSPIWISLFAVALAVVICIYACIWAVMIAFWAGFAAIAGGAVGALALAVGYFALGKIWAGVCSIGMLFFLCGVAVIAFLVCKFATKAIFLLTKKLACITKHAVMRKGRKK